LLQALQQRAKSQNGMVQYTIQVSALQIYLNHVYDLLSDDNQEALHIRAYKREQTLSQQAGESCGLHPKETYQACHDVQAFKHVLLRVLARRAQSSTNMNDRSSRSHLILTLAVRATGMHTGDAHSLAAGREEMSKLILVDLAGNERDSSRQERQNEASLREEGIAVNTSLLALSECLRERANKSVADSEQYGVGNVSSGTGSNTAKGKGTGKVKRKTGSKDSNEHTSQGNGVAGSYRKSALTRLLKEHLMCAKIFFLACCSPAAASVATTRQTLEYARTVKDIRTSAEDSALLFEQGVPIEVLPHAKLVECGKIPRSSEALTVRLNFLRQSVVRVMVSHKWLMPEQRLPDNMKNEKHRLLCSLFERLHAGGWIQNYDVLNVVDWIDFGECTATLVCVGTQNHVCVLLFACRHVILCL
jgi:hypothetical protein